MTAPLPPLAELMMALIDLREGLAEIGKLEGAGLRPEDQEAWMELQDWKGHAVGRVEDWTAMAMADLLHHVGTYLTRDFGS